MTWPTSPSRPAATSTGRGGVSAPDGRPARGTQGRRRSGPPRAVTSRPSAARGVGDGSLSRQLTMSVPSFAPSLVRAGTEGGLLSAVGGRSAPRGARRKAGGRTTGPVEIKGLPAHAPLVHAVVVLLPLTCPQLVAGAVWRPGSDGRDPRCPSWRSADGTPYAVLVAVTGPGGHVITGSTESSIPTNSSTCPLGSEPPGKEPTLARGEHECRAGPATTGPAAQARGPRHRRRAASAACEGAASSTRRSSQAVDYRTLPGIGGVARPVPRSAGSGSGACTGMRGAGMADLTYGCGAQCVPPLIEQLPSALGPGRPPSARCRTVAVPPLGDSGRGRARSAKVQDSNSWTAPVAAGVSLRRRSRELGERAESSRCPCGASCGGRVGSRPARSRAGAARSSPVVPQHKRAACPSRPGRCDAGAGVRLPWCAMPAVVPQGELRFKPSNVLIQAWFAAHGDRDQAAGDRSCIGHRSICSETP